MPRVVVFAEPALKGRLKGAPGSKLRYEFLDSPGDSAAFALNAFDAALVEYGGRFRPSHLRAVRKALPGKPVGAVLVRPSPPSCSGRRARGSTS